MRAVGQATHAGARAKGLTSKGERMNGFSDRAPSGAITLGRRTERAGNELVGLCRGMLADGHVCQMEAEFLKGWIERNSALVASYPFNRIYALLAAVLEDGKIDADESADLQDTLVRFVGGEAFDTSGETASLSTTLPLCHPEPAIQFDAAVFVVTGTFSFGTRRLVAQEIELRRGILAAAPSRKTHYLVIGELGSRDWLSSNAGTKIQKAVEIRDGGHPLAIVSEKHWAASLA